MKFRNFCFPVLSRLLSWTYIRELVAFEMGTNVEFIHAEAAIYPTQDAVPCVEYCTI